MEAETYQKIINSIKNKKDSSRNCKKRLLKEFPEIAPGTLGSIIGTQWKYKMMSGTSRVRRILPLIYDRYKTALAEGQEPGILVRLAEEIDYAPGYLAKLIVELHYSPPLGSIAAGLSKQELQKMMRDTTLIQDKDLALEVFLCTLTDDQCGPYCDKIKNIIGLEFEMKLQHLLRKNGVLFKTENDLFSKGYDKTPDIKLEVPVAVDGFIINWIESKALFGCESEHRQYVKEQYLSYWNRFGPGLVIYWASYIKTIIDPLEKRFIIRENLPKNFTFLNPDLIPAPTLTDLEK